VEYGILFLRAADWLTLISVSSGTEPSIRIDLELSIRVELQCYFSCDFSVSVSIIILTEFLIRDFRTALVRSLDHWKR